MTPRAYYVALTMPGRKRFARRAGVSLGYLRVNVFPAGQERPRQGIGMRTLLALADASEGLVSRREALEWAAKALYPEPQRINPPAGDEGPDDDDDDVDGSAALAA